MNFQNQRLALRLFSRRLTQFHDLFFKITKIACLIGSGCGFIYLWAFTREAGIPFPLELSVLPVTLLVIGLVSISATFMTMCGMVLPAILSDDLNKATKGYLKAEDCTDHIVLAKFKRYALCTWVPTVLSLSGMLLFSDIFTTAIWKNHVALFSLLFASAWIIYTPRFIGRFEEKRWDYCFVMFYHLALSIWAYVLMILTFLTVFPETERWPAWSTSLLILTIFTIIHSIISVPLQKIGTRNRLLPPFRNETVPSLAIALLLAGMATAASVFMPQMNSKIGGAVLRVFNAGGGVPIVICTKTMPPLRIAKVLDFGADHCSGKVTMQFDSGDRVYVSKIAAEKDARPNSIYFRQDEIQQKIYFQEVKGKTGR